MEQNENPESPQRDRYAAFDWENWDGQDSSVPDPPAEPDPLAWLAEPVLDEAGAERDGAVPAPPEAPPPAKWSEPPPHVPAPEDSGFYYRNGRPVPPTHPDHGPMHLIPRQHDGSFAAYYYCSKEELARAQVTAPPPRRHRRDGFSAERQQRFVEAYRDTGSLTDAARLTGISRSTAYNLINSPDGAAFRDALAEAAKGTDILLEATAIERAVKGQEEIVYYKGQRVGVRWKYDNRLLMSLLRARNPLKYAPLNEIEGWLKRRGIEPPADVEGSLDRLAAAEAEWGRRLPGEELPADPLLEAPSAPAVAHQSSPAFAGEGDRPQGGGGAAQPHGGGGAAQPQAELLSREPVQASTSSTSAAERAVQASTSSTLPAEPGARASSSSTLPAEAPAAPDPGDGASVYRPPPRPRLRQA